MYFSCLYIFINHTSYIWPERLQLYLPALFGAVVGRLEHAPDSQDECSALLVCKVKGQTFGITIFLS